MKSKNRLIVALLITGVVLFLVMQFWSVSRKNRDDAYRLAQLNPSTHDIHSVMEYMNPYMGNNSNTINLFNHLPLAIDNRSFHLISEEFTLEVIYQDTLLEAGKESMKQQSYAAEGLKDELNKIYGNAARKALIYDSAAAFLLIGNLEQINYRFADGTYQVKRTQMESFYPDFDHILDHDAWKQQVQDPLSSDAYVDETFEACFTKQ
jgi:hypothetical protein